MLFHEKVFGMQLRYICTTLEDKFKCKYCVLYLDANIIQIILINVTHC